MKTLVVALALLLSGCALSNDIGFLLTGRAENISWRNIPPPRPPPGPRLICLERAKSAGSDSEQWVADYLRCMQGD